jgi:RNA polymerase sigma factor (sigma-70 family)
MDADRLAGLLRQDPAVIKSLYTAHFPTVRQFVLRNSGTVDDAQDVFQEAVTILWLNVKEGRIPPGTDLDPGGYLFRVARNKWLDTLRSAAHKHLRVVADEQVLGAAAEEGPELEERLQRLRTVYAKLDERCREVLDRFYHERKDLATIAAILGVEEESIRTMKYRCMMKLRSFRRVIDGVDTNTRER